MAKKAKVKTIPFDAAEFLTTPEHLAEYLRAAIEEAVAGDPESLIRALNTAARARGMIELANSTGITRSGLYKALSGEGKPSFETVSKIVAALGMRFSIEAR